MIWANRLVELGMDGSLSGRRSEKLLAEECLSLDLAWLMRLGPIREGMAGDGEIIWTIGGTQIGFVKFRLDLRMVDVARLTLTYGIRLADGQFRDISQEIALTSTSQNFGGRRWWMRCPVIGARARKLYLPACADRFASRKAWNLGYRVERLSHFDRPFEKLFRVQRKLGGARGLAAGLIRPRGMWRRTFARHLQCFAALDAGCAGTLVSLIKNSSG
jgi:hypothetical protein